MVLEETQHLPQVCGWGEGSGALGALKRPHPAPSTWVLLLLAGGSQPRPAPILRVGILTRVCLDLVPFSSWLCSL